LALAHGCTVHEDQPANEEPIAAVTPDSACESDLSAAELVAFDEPKTGTLAIEGEGKLLALPLQHAKFTSVVTGTVAKTEIRQVFRNPLEHSVDALYMLPVHEQAAVSHYSLNFNASDQDVRTVQATLSRHPQTCNLNYGSFTPERSRPELFDRYWPGLFTQPLDRIPAGATIEVVINLVEPLEPDRGVYSLRIPTQLSPARCSALELSVVIDAGLPPQSLRADHLLDVRYVDSVAFVGLDRSSEPTPLDREFILTWRLDSIEPRAAIVAQAKGRPGYFTLTITPPKLVTDEQAIPRELVFVIDDSISMRGAPLLVAKGLVTRALAGLRPQDTFNVLRFSKASSALSDTLLPRTEHNLNAGADYVDAMATSSAASLLHTGLQAALRLPHEPGHLRLVVFVTDGYINDEDAFFRVIAKHRGDARIMAVGLSSAPNRYLLDGMAKLGRAPAVYIDGGVGVDEAVERVYQRIETPVLSNLEIDWQRLAVSELLPAELPDLFANQPLTVFGRYFQRDPREPWGPTTLSGDSNGERVEIPVSFQFAEVEELAAVSSIWARRKIDELLSHPNEPLNPKLASTVAEIALRHQLTTNFTHFCGEATSHVSYPDGKSATSRVINTPPARPPPPPSAFAYRREDGSIGNVRYTRPFTSAPSLSIKLIEPTITGTLDADSVHRTILDHQQEVNDCYAAALQFNPTLVARVELNSQISAQGEVRSVTVDSGKSEIGLCIAAASERWRFSETSDGREANVSYGFLLRPV